MWRAGRLSRHIVIRFFAQPVAQVILLGASLLLCVLIRTANVSQLEGKYLLGTDAYRFLRQADIIVSEGHLPQRDAMRWQPEGRDLETHLNLYSYALAHGYQILHRMFPALSLYQAAVYAPVVCYSLCLLLLYLIWREVFDSSIAILAVNFSAVFPSINLYRSTSGFADRDAFCLLLWVGMFLFYMKASDANGAAKGVAIKAGVYALISGIIAGMLALSWEGSGLATGIIAAWVGLRILRERLEPQDMRVYLIWYVCFALIALSLTHAYRNPLLPYAFLAIVVPGITLLCAFVFPVLRRHLTAHPIAVGKPLSAGFVSCVFGGGLGFLLLLGLAGLQSTSLGETLRLIQDNFMSPLGRSRLMRTVMELRDLSGPLWVGRYSVVVLAAMAGSVVLVHRFFSSERVNLRLAIAGFEVLLCGTLLSLFVTNPNASNAIYGFSILAGSISIFAAYLLRGEEGTTTPTNDEKVLLVLVWLLIGLLSNRGAYRYGFFLDPLLSVLVSFLILKALRFFVKGRMPPIAELGAMGLLVISELHAGSRLSIGLDLTGWRMLGLSALGLASGVVVFPYLFSHGVSHRQRFASLALLCILILFISSDTFHKGFVGANVEAVRQGVILKPHLRTLQDSFTDIAEHTDEKSVIAAWWDYGSMLNWFAKRATVVDEDHFIPYWIFMMARHVFSALSEGEATSFLSAHRATHLMITTGDIARLDAITYTGADATFDRAASIHPLQPMTQRQPDNSVEVTECLIYGFFATDDLELGGETYAPGHWQIQGVSIIHDIAHDSWRAMVHGVAGTKRFSIPPKEFRFADDPVRRQKEGAPGSIIVFLSADQAQFQAFYVSEKAKRLLAVRLYFFGEELPGFSLVYDTNSTFHCDPQGLRLWKIDSPERIAPDEKYLVKDFPAQETRLEKSWQRGDLMGFQKF